MRKLTVLFFTIAIILLSQSCRKENTDQNNPVNRTDDEQVLDLLNIQDEAAMVFKQSFDRNRDTLSAVLDMGKWLAKQNEIKTVKFIDLTTLAIYYKNGINSSISVAKEGLGVRQASGQSRNGSVTTYHFGGNGDNDISAKLIGSNKVLIICTELSEFYSGKYPYLEMFKSSKVPLEVTLVTDNKCTLDLVETFHQYGLILLNTHGTFTGAFQLYTGSDKFDLPVKIDKTVPKWEDNLIEELKQKSGNEIIKKIKEGKYEFEYSILIDYSGEIRRDVAICVTGLAVREMTKMKDAVVVGNYCFSGQPIENAERKNMPESWKSAGVNAYYGYAYSDGISDKVNNSFCVEMEKRIITRLVQDGDSTGVAHLDENLNEYAQFEERRKVVEKIIKDSLNVETVKSGLVKEKENLYCKLYDSPEYAYGCGEFTDPRDGQKYKLACIEDQIWFAENLRYQSAGVDYDNNPANSATLGKLYTRQEAMNGANSSTIPSYVQGICPIGWHVPSKAEWEKLIRNVGGSTAAEKKLRSKEGWPEPNTDDFGFNMKPSGGYSNRFFNKGTAAYFWTTTFANSGHYQGLNAYYPSLVFYEYIDAPSQTWKLSCRCVKD